VLTLGNHDAALPGFVARTGLPLRCETAWPCGPHLLVHGDRRETRLSGLPEPPGAGFRNGFLIMGHEHPAVVLGDGVTTGARCPCFLVGANRLMLPAFSRWAAGVVIGREPFMSEAARGAQWHTAVAIMGERLLPVPWRRGFPPRMPT